MFGSKKFLLGLGSVGVLAATFGFAASLNVTSANLGAGTETVASCQTEALDITWGTSYDATSGTYKVDSVSVANVQDSCDTGELKVTMADGTNVSIASMTKTLAFTEAGPKAVVFTSAGDFTAFEADLLQNTAVVIEGGVDYTVG